MQDITDQQLEEAFEKAPVAVQDSLSGGAATQFILAARERYVLNVDVVGKLSLKIRDLMLGFLSPADFYASLLEFGIAIDAAKKITNDINTEIFLPIRSELEGKSTPKPASSEKVAPQTPVAPKEELPKPVAVPATVSETESSMVPVVVPSRQPVVQTVPIQQQFHSSAAYGQPAATVHVYVHSPMPVPVAPPVAAPLSVETPVAEVSSMPTQSDTPPNSYSPKTASVEPLPKLPTILPEAPDTKINKEYGSDPYREPV